MNAPKLRTMFVAAAPPDAQDFDGDAYDRECDEAERLRRERLIAVTVPADEDADDCLAAAVATMKKAAKGDLNGYDLEPRWFDDATRERVRLLLPFWARFWETVPGAELVSLQAPSIADQLRADLRRLDRGESPRTIAAGWVDHIQALRDEAAIAGDSECVTICDRALNGSPFVTRRAALRIVLNVLANARGNQGAA